MNDLRTQGSRFGAASAWAVLVLGLFSFAPAAGAAPLVVTAEEDPTIDSFFTLDFGQYGGERTAFISTTSLELQVDPDSGEARFVNYYQEVEPLLLPGDYSTGDITVTIAQSNGGTFDLLTGEFATDDDYSVAFTGDLSDFGIESPVILPSQSAGTITFEVGIDGTITMEWVGSGQLQNPFDPNEVITFNYRCEVHTVVEEDAQVLLRIALAPAILNAGLDSPVQQTLLRKVDQAAAAAEADKLQTAVGELKEFVEKVERLRDRRIPGEVADDLIAKAEGILALLIGG